MKQNVVNVPLTDICTKKDLRIQQRKYGLNMAKVREIEATLDTPEDLKNPITLMRWNGKLVVKHGNHRLHAFKRLWMASKKKKFVTIPAFIEEDVDEALIAESQLADNATHTPSSPASRDDWIKYLRKDFPRLEKTLGFSIKKNDAEFRRALLDYILEGRGGFAGKRITLARKTLQGYILEAVRLHINDSLSSYKSYDTAGARAFARECLPVMEDIAIQPVRNMTELCSGSAGQAINNLMKSGQRTVAVCYADTTAHKNRIQDFRNSMLSKFKEIQKSIKVNGKPLFKEIYFLPQVLEGQSADDMETLIDARSV